MSEKRTQCAQILAHLQTGAHITPLEALDLFKCMRLAPRIHDLKAMGHKIECKMRHQNGKYFGEYFIP
jgi:hypothetical protein